MYLNYLDILFWMKIAAEKIGTTFYGDIKEDSRSQKQISHKLQIQHSKEDKLLLWLALIGIKLSLFHPLHCPFTTPPIRLFVLIPRTSSINIRACSRHAAHISVASVNVNAFIHIQSETLVESARGSKWEHSACYRTMDGPPVALSACL